MNQLGLNDLVDTLKAAAESSRLRILALLKRGDLTVSDITLILGQSQPRVSRHLKLLQEAGLIDRYQEGSWAYFRLSDSTLSGALGQELAGRVASSDSVIIRDLERLSDVKSERQNRARDYFRVNAKSWDEIRSMHVPDEAVEAQLKEIIGKAPFQAMLDLGTGTGRLLELFAGQYRRGIGIDMSRDMLSVARANLDRAGITHAQVRQGDIYALPVDRESFDVVTLHQVLHFLDDPAQAIRQAARALRPSGRMVIVDFAPHNQEFLRDQHAHARLGFSDEQISQWVSEAGLELVSANELAPKAGERLTVKLWFSRDPRLLIAAGADTANFDLETV